MEFESYENIKRYLSVSGVPKYLDTAQELEVLGGIIGDQRATLSLFKFVCDLVLGDEDYVTNRTKFEGNDWHNSIFQEEAKKLVIQMSAMGIFGVDRYSSKLDLNNFFDGNCPTKILLAALIQLCELAEIRKLEVAGYYKSK